MSQNQNALDADKKDLMEMIPDRLLGPHSCSEQASVTSLCHLATLPLCHAAFLIRSLVVAGLTAGFAIHQPVGAEAYVDDRLAQATELLAFARAFGALALHAVILRGTGSGTHAERIASSESHENVTSVTIAVAIARAFRIGDGLAWEDTNDFSTSLTNKSGFRAISSYR
jgi:hypothetical protein